MAILLSTTPSLPLTKKDIGSLPNHIPDPLPTTSSIDTASSTTSVVTHTHTPTTISSAAGASENTKTDGVEEVFAFDRIEDALEAFEKGEFLVVMDDESRENEGDLIISAAGITTEQMAWFIKVTSGFVCISLPGERVEELKLPMMVANNTDMFKTAYTITVDYAIGTTTGISAHDRALTARKLAQGAPAHEFNRPGHLVPLRAREGGTLTRKGHTEAAVDLCRVTGLPPAGLLCELVNDDLQGTMARRNDCRAFANKHGLKMISVEMIAEYKRKIEAGQ